jgi:quercetin dioxygenase-like cupin family protein
MGSGLEQEIRIGGLAIRFLVEKETSGGSVAIFELDVAVGAKVPVAHSHDGYEETIYGLAGVLTLIVDRKKTEVRPGDALCIPRGAIHRFDNLHTDEARALAVVTPGLLGPDFFREVAQVFRAAAGAPPDPGAIGSVMRRHGLTPHPS